MGRVYLLKKITVYSGKQNDHVWIASVKLKSTRADRPNIKNKIRVCLYGICKRFFTLRFVIYLPPTSECRSGNRGVHASRPSPVATVERVERSSAAGRRKCGRSRPRDADAGHQLAVFSEPVRCATFPTTSRITPVRRQSRGRCGGLKAVREAFRAAEYFENDLECV